MKNKHSALLASLIAALVIGGCASTTPTATFASSQSGSASQSTVVPVNPNSVSPTPTPPPTSTASVKPTTFAVYFDYDSFAVNDQYANVVRSNADYLMKTNGALELDGNADERGSREYNMALGQKRADAVKRALTVLGVKTDRIETISFGEDKPKATGHEEQSWAENRRVDFVLKSK